MVEDELRGVVNAVIAATTSRRRRTVLVLAEQPLDLGCGRLAIALSAGSACTSLAATDERIVERGLLLAGAKSLVRPP